MGTRSGHLDSVMEEISNDYEEITDTAIDNMIARFEPTIVAVLAVSVQAIETAQTFQIAEFAQNLTRWTAYTLLRILEATRGATQIKKDVQWYSLTRCMSTEHITTLRVADVLTNIGLRKGTLILPASISQSPESWPLQMR